MKLTTMPELPTKDPYNTNLAAEFYVLSVLHRLGLDANLTLGNKKSVDIAVIRGRGDAITIDVKGLAGKSGWPVDNVKDVKEKHYFIFVSFLDKIGDPSVLPEVWVVPSAELPAITYNAPGGRKIVQRNRLRKDDCKLFLNGWSMLKVGATA